MCSGRLAAPVWAVDKDRLQPLLQVTLDDLLLLKPEPDLWQIAEKIQTIINLIRAIPDFHLADMPVSKSFFHFQIDQQLLREGCAGSMTGLCIT